MASSSDETIDVENPATEQLIASVLSATAADVDAAVTAARAALPRWWQTTVAERAGYLRRIRDGLAKRQDEIAATIASEMGCPLRTATMLLPTRVSNS